MWVDKSAALKDGCSVAMLVVHWVLQKAANSETKMAALLADAKAVQWVAYLEF